MTDVIWPLDLRPAQQAFFIRTNTRRFESPLTGHVQVQELDGARWVAQMSFTRGEVDARRMDAFLAALDGPVGNVFMPDFRRLSAKGSLAGSPQLDSGTGATLSLSGFTPDAVGVLLAGDLIQTSEGRAHMVVQNIDADSMGEASVPIAPVLRDPVTVGALITDNCRVKMQLLDDNQAQNLTDHRLQTNFELQLIEVLPDQ
ncbi:MAG: hypothetical protein H6867_04785 [Rhodospirillales bacterium]|nr:hypothetical protein [Rhodospirillales bacterium]MCB9994817.1 hypothetical protein [Rhodospirillales bacterium]